ncbi:phage Gp37/Gp68 family protein [Sphingobium sp. ZW T5_29]|uniref:phage Gp37/Gp68 family protein n=1 Tax=Sphingobium sp. ZW T5_29 TaxID=3378077 RepID=UPI003854AB00
MAENTKIEWTDHTFNPWIGCTKVGPGCDNCYAADLSKARLGVPWGAGEPRRHTAASTWKQPRAWNNRAAKLGIRYRVFCASLADVFDNEVPAEWRAELFQLIRETPHLDWLLVTKRIGNAEKMARAAGCFPSNVWLGATIVNQAEAERDIPKLLAVQGPRFRFLSMEPLLGPVDLTMLSLSGDAEMDALRPLTWASQVEEWRDTSDTWQADFEDWFGHHPDNVSGLIHGALDWVIVGGESGPHARPMHPDWARSLRKQCEEAGVPFLFKQWGEWFPYGGIDADGCQNSRDLGERSGKWHIWGENDGFSARVGKKQAGRFLDGIQHDGVPS